MANTNAISQMMQNQLLTSNKSDSKAASGKESFGDVLNQATDTSKPENKTESKTDAKTETKDNAGKQPVDQNTEEEVADTIETSVSDLSAYMLQSLLGEAQVSQDTAVQAPAEAAPEVQEAEAVLAPGQTTEEFLKETVLAQKSGTDIAEAVVIEGTEGTEGTEEAPQASKSEGKGEGTIPKSLEQGMPAQAKTDVQATAVTTTTAPQTTQVSGQGEVDAENVASAVAHQAEPVEEMKVKEEVKPEHVDMTGIKQEEPAAKEPEVIRIKVAEPFRQVDQSTMNQISNSIHEQAAQGREELMIQLEPEHLGRIAIKISVEENSVKVILNCDNLKTQNLLAEKSAGIGRIVEDNLQRPVVVEMKEDNFWSQQKNATDQHQNPNSREQNQSDKQSAEDTDLFIQQLRLGLNPGTFAS